MRTLRLILGWVIGLPAFLLGANCAAMALLGQLGRFGPILDIPNHFVPIWLAGSVIAALIGLAYGPDKRRWITGAGIVGIIASLLLMAPEYLRSTGPKASTTAPGQLKVVQLNAWLESRDPNAEVRWLQQIDPDIAVIEETTPYLREQLAKDGRWHITCADCEEIILSKAAPLPMAPHPPNPRPTWNTPNIVQARFQDAHGTFAVIGVHNGWPLGYFQRWQERRVLWAVAQFPRERTILAGDFNSTPWSFERRRRDGWFGLIRRERAVFSWPANPTKGLPPIPTFLPIDHVFAGKDWATVQVERGPRLSSDHYPLIVTLAPR